jgi:hypothetical protein
VLIRLSIIPSTFAIAGIARSGDQKLDHHSTPVRQNSVASPKESSIELGDSEMRNVEIFKENKQYTQLLMSAPEKLSMPEVAMRTGVSKATLHLWQA